MKFLLFNKRNIILVQKFGGGSQVKDECRGSVMTRPLRPRLGDSKGGFSGKGSSVSNEDGDFGKRKR